jgi:tRNA G18 (ribose-2'-O)-methylase SpoU
MIEMAKTNNMALKFVNKEKMDKLTKNKPSEGVCIKSQPRDYIDIKKFNEVKKYIKKETGNIIVLFEKIDSQTLASVSRTSLFMGVDMLVLGKEDRPVINSNIAKLSLGASEIINLFSVKFVQQFLIGIYSLIKMLLKVNGLLSLVVIMKNQYH